MPGARCYGDVRGLFGGAASRVVVPAARVVRSRRAWASEAVLLALAATAYHAIARRRVSSPTSSSATACSAGCWPASRSPTGGRAAGRLGEESRRAPAAHGYQVVDPADDDRGATTARSTTSAAIRAARHARRPPRAGRRDRARRLLRRAARLRLSAGLHERGAHPDRGRMAPAPISPQSRRSSRRAACRSRPDHAPARRCGRRGRLPHRLRRSRLPQDDPRLEDAAHETCLQPHCADARSASTRTARQEAAIEPDPVRRRAGPRKRRSSRSTARAASARASRWPTSPT